MAAAITFKASSSLGGKGLPLTRGLRWNREELKTRQIQAPTTAVATEVSKDTVISKSRLTVVVCALMPRMNGIGWWETVIPWGAPFCNIPGGRGGVSMVMVSEAIGQA